MYLKLHDIVKRMNENFALCVDFLESAPSTTLGIIGNNGAGKTTLLSLICGLRTPDTGTVVIDHKKLTRENLDWWKSQTGVYLDESFMFDYYTVFEHFEFMASAWKVDETDFHYRVGKYEPVFDLKQYYGHRISTLSSGNKKKTGLMGTLLVNPKVLIWDEPFSGLDPRSQEYLKQLLEQYKQEQQATIIISSHDLNHVAEICDRVVILDEGRIVRVIKEKISYAELKDEFLKLIGSDDAKLCKQDDKTQ